MIVDSITTWEPRIVISDIEVSSNIDKKYLNEFDTYDEQEAILYIRIKFVDPENIQTIEELVLESPIGG
jgi:phage baseplate assembly protein W